MQISIKFEGLEKVKKQLAALSGPQAREAYAKAVNDTAYQVRRAMQAEITAAFDRPTNYILSAPKVLQATAENLTATIKPTLDARNRPSLGGKISIDPQKILRAQADGGTRRDKRSEVALRRVGILPAGYQTRIPTDPFPGSDDGKGNLRGPFLVQLISYFQGFGEQGYRANMTDKRKEKLEGRGVSQSGYKTINGVVYFVSYGKLRSNQSRHLGVGIWAKKGTHGVDVKPVLMFVKTPNYKPRLSMERIAKAADVDNYLSRRMRYRIRQAFEGLQS